MIAETCELCQYALDLENEYKKGHTVEGGTWMPEKVDYQGTIGGVMTFEVFLRIDAADVLDQSGESVKHYDAGTSTHIYAITDRGG